MRVDGKKVSLITGTDIPKLKDKLFRGYFHLPDPNQPKKRRRS